MPAGFVEDLLTKKDDYYALLGVAKDSSDTDISKAYKKLALKLHPDKCKHKDAERVFAAVTDAKNVLMDPMKRQVYDDGGAEGLGNDQDVNFSVGLKFLIDAMFRQTAYRKFRAPFMPDPDVAFNERGERIDPPEKVVILPMFVHFLPLLFTLLAYAATCATTQTPTEFALRYPNEDLGLTHRLDTALNQGTGVRDTLPNIAVGPVAYFVSNATAELLFADAGLRADFDTAVQARVANEAFSACDDAKHVALQLRHRGHPQMAKEHVAKYCRSKNGVE